MSKFKYQINNKLLIDTCSNKCMRSIYIKTVVCLKFTFWWVPSTLQGTLMEGKLRDILKVQKKVVWLVELTHFAQWEGVNTGT